ncbi:hypothetical protein H633G_10297 [Metarhizium anisopliae BRIP 53284]|nr:hypothetical protein H633G_10297 [Metarhizium anisopliae BRIP 53284]
MAEENKPLQKRDRTNDNFRRVMNNYMKKGNLICQRYGADIHIVVRRKHRFYTYSSTQDSTFPPSHQQVEQSYPLPIQKTPLDYPIQKA